MKYIVKYYLFCLLFFSNSIYSQPVWEDTRSLIYPYLTRLADKGFIQLDDVTQPLTREQIYNSLLSLKKNNNLNAIETNELKFYLREFKLPYTSKDSNKLFFSLFKNDLNKRWRGASFGDKNLFFQIDPVSGFKQSLINKRILSETGNGFHAKLLMGEKIAFQIYIRDITRSGDSLNHNRLNSDDVVGLRIDTNIISKSNFTDFRTTLAFKGKNYVLTIGNDHINWGYGVRGKIVLGNRTPSYPFVRFDFKPVNWFSFNYAHIWLQSNVIDSNKLYNLGNTVYGGRREIYIPSYLVTHSASFLFKKGLTFSLGESIVYSDQLFIPYFFPMLFFKFVDITNRMGYNNLASSNTQFFSQFSVRNLIPKTHTYITFFIDELRLKYIFNSSKSRNQFGYTIGVQNHDLLLKNLSLGFEYTRVNPFVYSNFIPAQQYRHANFVIGDWMGNNFDRLTLHTTFKPFPRFMIRAHAEKIRKGGIGNLLQQYFAEPQPSFLFDRSIDSYEYYTGFNYEIIHHLYLFGSFSLITNIEKASLDKNTTKQLQIGLKFGW